MRDLIRPWNFVVAVLLGAMGAAAGTVTVPNSFTAGTPAKAADVNADFAAVATAINNNSDAIATLQTTVKNIPASQGPTRPQGPAGPAGPVGQTGTHGVQGPAGTGTMLVKDITGKLVGSYFVAPYDPIVPALTPYAYEAYSYLSFNGTAAVCSLYQGIGLVALVPVASTFDLSTLNLTPPFSVQ